MKFPSERNSTRQTLVLPFVPLLPLGKNPPLLLNNEAPKLSPVFVRRNTSHGNPNASIVPRWDLLYAHCLFLRIRRVTVYELWPYSTCSTLNDIWLGPFAKHPRPPLTHF